MKKHRFLVLSIVFHALLGGAQTIQPEPVSITDGLSSAVANGIFQDSYGLIWVPTQAGLNVYDGYKTRTFWNNPNDPNSLINNLVWHVDEDSDKNIWIATDHGISKYIRAENRFVNYPPEVLLENFPVDLTLIPGGKFSHISTDNNLAFYNIREGNPVYDITRSNGFTYEENVAAFYFMMNATPNSSISLNAGVRMENTTSLGFLDSEVPSLDNRVPRNYNDFFPNIGISYNNQKNSVTAYLFIQTKVGDFQHV